MSDKSMELGDDARPLFQRVIDVARAWRLKVGDPMPSEAQLCRELNAGRQQIREALSALDALGVVASRQGARRTWKGFDLSTFLRRTTELLGDSDEMVRDLLEVRHTLEKSMLPMAAHKLSRAELNRLRAISREMIVLAERGESFEELDAEFHRALLAPLANTALDAILQTFWAVFATFRMSHSIDENVAEDPEIAAMHELVIDAIEEGDVQRAVHELDKHFYGIWNRFPDMALRASSALAR